MATILKDLDDTGIKIDAEGYLSDWFDRPPKDARPKYPCGDAGAKKKKRSFLVHEELLLRQWCWAAKQQGIFSGSLVFEQLECLYPVHSWQAYDSKWRNGGLSAREQAQISFDAIFPNLTGCNDDSAANTGTVLSDDDSSGESRWDLSIAATSDADASPHKITYCDFRVDVAHALYKNLHFQDEDEFRGFLTEPWVISACDELIRSNLLKHYPAGDVADISSYTRRGQGQHRWKIQKALRALELPESLYLRPSPSTDNWNNDNHDIRFMCMVVRSALDRKECRWMTATGKDRSKLCLAALWLTLWLRWLYRPTLGESRDMQRTRRRKEEWRAFLSDNCRAMARASSGEACMMPTAVVGSQQAAQNTFPSKLDLISGQTEWSTPKTTQESKSSSAYTVRPGATLKKVRPDIEKRVPVYLVPTSKSRNQQKGLFWLTEDALLIYRNIRDTRLNSWGVPSNHRGTCVLINSRWNSLDPVSLSESFVWDPVHYDEASRLQLCLGDLTTTWARAVAWFENWPRRGIDLDGFVVYDQGPWPEMHGSHLCHQRYCVLPGHVIYEEKSVNLSRNSCAFHAATFRAYGMVVPEHCVKHEPPCLLQHASLTLHEAILVQFHVLRLARGLSTEQTYTRPQDHPELLPTFETRLPLIYGAPAVAIQEASLVNVGTSRAPPVAQEKFTVYCIYCTVGQHASRQITAFWSHLKMAHEQVAKDIRLGEVVRTAALYREWIEARGFDYAQANPATWAMLCQATSSDFTWEHFEGWRLYRDRHYTRHDDLPEGYFGV